MPLPTHFHLANTSDLDLLGLQLTISIDPSPIVTCTVVRERGSLTFDSPTPTIPFGNLYPEESLELYITFHNDMIPLTLCELLDSLVIDEQLYEESSMPSPLADYITFSEDNLSDS